MTAILAAASSIQAAPELDKVTHDQLITVIVDCVRQLDRILARLDKQGLPGAE